MPLLVFAVRIATEAAGTAGGGASSAASYEGDKGEEGVRRKWELDVHGYTGVMGTEWRAFEGRATGFRLG